MLVAVLLAVPLLSGGNCAFFFSSGGGSSDDDEPRKGLTVAVNKGQFVDAPVQGLFYQSGSVSGFTDIDGQFEYEEGEEVRFFVGDIALGESVSGKSLVTPLDLVEGGDLGTTAVINIARLLQSLDADEDEATITIPAEVQSAAVRGNELLAGSIDFLDFADDPAFINAASQLVAVLTDGYPRTMSLVNREQAIVHPERSLAKFKAEQ